MDIKKNFHNKLQTIREGVEQLSEAKDEREYGYEGDMAITQLKTICRNAENLLRMMKPDTDLPEWVQSKITKSEDYISTAHDYLASEMNEEVKQLDELKGKGSLEKIRDHYTKRRNKAKSNAEKIIGDEEFPLKTIHWNSEVGKHNAYGAKAERAKDLIRLRDKNK